MSNQPTHNIYQVIPREGDKSDLWNKCGVAWEHTNKEGLTLELEMLPLTGKLVILKNKPRKEFEARVAKPIS